MSAPDAVLHIGMPHSGAALVQQVLSRLRPQLRSHDVAYIGHGRMTRLDHIAGWERRAGADHGQATAFERELAQTVEHERRQAASVGGGPVTVLLSSHHLVGSRTIDHRDADTFRPQAEPAVRQVIRALDAKRVRLVLYTRRQDRLMELCYLREIQKGRHHQFAEQFPRRFEPVLDYVDLIERLRGLPEVCDVTVRPDELIDAGPLAFIDDFLDVIGVRGVLDLGVVADRPAPDRAYSRQGLHIALAMNPHLETDQDRSLVREFVLRNFAVPDERHSRFLPKRARQQILDAYGEANRRLFRTYLVDLPEDGYSSDAATNALGTVLPPAVRASAGHPADGQPPRVRGLAGMLPLLVRGGRKKKPARAAARRLAHRAVYPAKRALGRFANRSPLLYRLKVRRLARRCDVFLVSFPKCGRTWLRVMIGIALGDHFGVSVRNVRRFTNADVRRPGLPRVLATHDDSPQMKRAHHVIHDKRGYRNTRVIVLVRDPRDVVVSLYFHVTHRRRQPYDGSLADFVRDPVGSLASLLAFYDAWAAQLTTPKDLLLVRYEDIHADPGLELRRVLAFLGIHRVSDATVARAVADASFERLQRLEREGTAATRALRTETTEDPESYKVRRGKVGGYLDYLDAADIGHIAKLVEASHGARDLGYAEIDTDGRTDSV